MQASRTRQQKSSRILCAAVSTHRGGNRLATVVILGGGAAPAGSNISVYIYMRISIYAPSPVVVVVVVLVVVVVDVVVAGCRRRSALYSRPRSVPWANCSAAAGAAPARAPTTASSLARSLACATRPYSHSSSLSYIPVSSSFFFFFFISFSYSLWSRFTFVALYELGLANTSRVTYIRGCTSVDLVVGLFFLQTIAFYTMIKWQKCEDCDNSEWSSK